MSPETETRVGHCKRDPIDVYIGRGPGGRHLLCDLDPLQRGWLGNPYGLGDYSRQESIDKFREAFEHRLERDEEFRETIAGLAGLRLGCWCRTLDEEDPACHGDVIAEWADRLHTDEESNEKEGQR